MKQKLSTPRELKENLSLRAHPHLIGIDGPDGVGKGTFVAEFTKTVSVICGAQNVISTSGTRFEACSKSQKLEKKLKTVLNPTERNRLFLLSTKIIFEEIVIPSLKKGQIVILDSSDLRHLAYVTAMYGKGSSVWKDTFRQIIEGKLTCQYQPGIRIILTAPSSDLLKNLKKRESTDEGDPTNIKQAEKRLEAYRKTINLFRGFAITGDTKWINVINWSVSPHKVKKHLSKLIKEEIIPEFPSLLLNYHPVNLSLEKPL